MGVRFSQQGRVRGVQCVGAPGVPRLSDELAAFDKTFGDFPHRGQRLLAVPRLLERRMESAFVRDGNAIPASLVFSGGRSMKKRNKSNIVGSSFQG